MRLAKQPQTLSRLPLPPQVRSQSISPHCSSLPACQLPLGDTGGCQGASWPLPWAQVDLS